MKEHQETQQPEPNYWSFIPHSVRNDNSISFGARILYSEISSLTNTSSYCWASNSHFVKIFESSNRTITRWIGELKRAGHIRIQYVERPGNLTARHIFPCLAPRTKKADTQDENGYHNNISNNISNKKTSCPDKYTFTDDDRLVAGEIYEFAKISTPDLKKPNAEAWANDVRLLRTIDNKSHQQIRDRVRWLITNDFWRPIVQSPAGLRRNWDTMSARANVIKEKTPAEIQEDEYQAALAESRERKKNEHVEQ